MKILGIRHVGVVVESIPKAIEFYNGVLGLKVYEEASDWVTDFREVHAMGLPDCKHRIATLEAPDKSQVELVEFEDPTVLEGSEMTNYNGKEHISFLVDDISAWVDRLAEEGLAPFSQPLSYETPDAEGGVAYWMQFKDPFGVVVEMMQY